MSLLKQLRKEMGLTQFEMAEKLDISVQAYRNYEIGKRPMPYKVIIAFLKLRNTDEDKKILKEIEGWY